MKPLLVGCSLSPRSRMTRPPSTSAKRPHCCVHPQQVTRFSATASAPLRPPNATLDQAVGRNRVGSPVHELRVSVRGTALPSPDIPPIEARGRVSSVRAHCGAQRQRESSRRCHVPRRVDRKRFGEGREDLDRPARAEAWQRAVVVVPSLRRLPQSAPGCGADKLLQIDLGRPNIPPTLAGIVLRAQRRRRAGVCGVRATIRVPSHVGRRLDLIARHRHSHLGRHPSAYIARTCIALRRGA